MGAAPAAVVPTGWSALDAELPGGGWPCGAVTELLQPQPTLAEWRLLGPALRQLAERNVVFVGPAKWPHLPGLQHLGLDERQLVWIRAETPAERLWVTEQLVKANGTGLVVAWLPQARQEQIRRLQIAAQAGDGLVVLCRPASAAHDPSAAPLRIEVGLDPDWRLRVHVRKRRGSAHETPLLLPSMPGGLSDIITPRLSQPSTWLATRLQRDPDHVPAFVGRAPGRAASGFTA